MRVPPLAVPPPGAASLVLRVPRPSATPGAPVSRTPPLRGPLLLGHAEGTGNSVQFLFIYLF